MELGIFQALASELRGPALAGYLAIDPAVAGDVGAWSQRMIHRKVKPTRRVMLEVYA